MLMKKFITVSNIIVLGISLIVFLITAFLKPEIVSHNALIDQLHDFEANSSPERREESIKALLTFTDFRLHYANTVTNSCLLLSCVSVFICIVNLICIRKVVNESSKILPLNK